MGRSELLVRECWRHLLGHILATLLPDEVSRVMVDSLQVAAITDDLTVFKYYLRRQLRREGLSLTALREYYSQQPSRGPMSLPQLGIAEHHLRSRDGLLRAISLPASTGE